jgi:hypothetical protein
MTPAALAETSASPSPPPNWYPDPWGVAPWRWWDGTQWSAAIYGPYGEAWPLPTVSAPPFVRKGPGIEGGGIAAAGVGIGIAGTVVVAIVFAILEPGRLTLANPWYFLASQFALWVGLVGAVMLASRRHGTGRLSVDYGLSWPRLRDVGLGAAGAVVARIFPVIVLICLVVAGSGFGTPNGASPKVLGVTPSGTAGWAVVIALTVFGAPLVEELFFRGLLQGAFSRRVGPVPALFVTALIFSFSHVFDEGLLAPLALFPLALVLGYLRHRTGRLAAGMVAHSLFNASLFLLFLVPAFR